MGSLRIQTKILLGGLALASLILVFGQARIYVLERDLNSLIQQCSMQDDDEFGGVMDCDPDSLHRQGNFGNLKGLQYEIAFAQASILGSRSLTKEIPLAVLFLALIPWLWYFLLKRVREISDAIFGR